MKKDRDKFINPKEFKLFLGAAKKYNLFWYWFFRAQAMLGARVGEMVLLRGKDLDLKNNLVCISTLKRRDSKVSIIRENYMGDKFNVEEIWASLEDKKLINYWKSKKIPPEKFVYPTAKRNAQNAFKTICRLAGLGENYSSHALRHLFGIAVYGDTKDILLTAKKLRHKNLNTSAIYVHFLELDDKKIAKGVSKKILGG